MLIDMIFVRMMKVAIMEVIYVIAVAYRCVAASGSMFMGMV